MQDFWSRDNREAPIHSAEMAFGEGKNDPIRSYQTLNPNRNMALYQALEKS